MINSDEARICPMLLKLRREISKLTPQESAEKINVEVERWEKWEKGEEFPTFDELNKISELYGLPVRRFYRCELNDKIF